MNNKINKRYFGDVILMAIFLILMWAILLFVRSGIVEMSQDAMTQTFISAACFLALTFGTASLVAVWMHLTKHKNRIYKEDIMNGELMKNGKI
jgi:hypothetical protein